MKTRAAVLKEMKPAKPYSASRPLELVDLELDDPGPGEGLIRTRAAGLCHSDLSVINGNRPRPMPMALGHEAAREVVALGDPVDDLPMGAHVRLTFVPSSRHCLPCVDGRP